MNDVIFLTSNGTLGAANQTAAPYRLTRTVAEICEDLEWELLADTLRIATESCEGLIGDTRSDRSWMIVRIVEVVD